MQQRVADQRAAGVESGFGVQVEFEGRHGTPLAAGQLARDSQGIELLNVRQRGDQTLATLFVREGRLDHFSGLIDAYAAHRCDKNNKPRDHQKLIDALQSIHPAATFESLWTDTADALPASDDEPIWWEAWLPAGNDWKQSLADFRRVTAHAGGLVQEQVLRFPERLVVMLHASKAALQQWPLVLERMAELRRAKTTAAFFDEMPLNEQQPWVNDLQQRLHPQPPGHAWVTLLDTGVNHGHPLLSPLVSAADCHTIEPGWGTNDQQGHGTELAGLALLGDLTPALSDQSLLEVPHRLESVKVLRRGGDNEGQSYGVITTEAVSRVEVTDPWRQRVFTMAVSSTDGRDRGRPSSWSATIDRLASDHDDNGSHPRLFLLCAGNIADPEAWAIYPDSLSTNSIHDPGQAWNALTVGACTELTTLSGDDAGQFRPVAPAGGLSPYTSTSATWDNDWPLKPDIVMEGGNAAIDDIQECTAHNSLSLLTTSRQLHKRLLTVTWATSAATALAAGMAARIQATYPDYWPETIRALMVHAARWTPAMLAEYAPYGLNNQQTRRTLLRHCGYGVPSLERALYSASDSLTLVVQDQLQPYHRDGSDIKTKDMHLHDLPWPTEQLEALGATLVTLRVTLSYFIEPNPGERGGIDKYAYQSHALRFDVRRPLETLEDFRRRINAQATSDDAAAHPGGSDAGWSVGKLLRQRGSLSSDSWTGTAAELASRSQLAIYPGMGWWRNRRSLGRHNRLARYALIVSIEAPGVEQDLYAAVATQLAVPVVT